MPKLRYNRRRAKTDSIPDMGSFHRWRILNIIRTGVLGLAVFPVVMTAQPKEPNLSTELFGDMAHTYGVWMGQNLTFTKVEEAFPELRPNAQVARMKFHAVFGKSMAAIESKLSEVSKEQWGSFKARMAKEGARLLSSDTYENRDKAINFIVGIEKRTKGELIDRRALQTLLIWNPEFRRNPADELAAGFKSKYESDGVGKADTVKFKLEYPSSWSAADGERPHIVKKFVSEAGRGPETALVFVKRFTQRDGATADEMVSQLGSPRAKETVPPGGLLYSAKRISFDGLPGSLTEYRYKGDRMGIEFVSHVFSYSTAWRGRLIQLQVYCPDDNASVERIAPLVRLMANSFVIMSQYE